MKKYLFALAGGFLVSGLHAQLSVNYSIPVLRANGDTMKLAWCGGLNNPQFSNIDLNNDDIKDLFVFDRTGNRVLTFLGHGTANTVDFTYAPQYESGLPKMVNWALILDYNCDGIDDIYTYSEGRITTPQGVGIRVYRGYYDPGNHIQFALADSTLKYPVNSLPTNLFVSAVDIPAIADVNGDGDMDVLTFQITGGYVQYFENLSAELGFGCDSLIFKKADNCWGDFFEPALTRADLLDQPCPFFNEPVADERLHAGSTQLAWDNTGDGVLEFLKGDISWDNLVYQLNDGSTTDAHIFAEDTLFPSYDEPASVFIFPAPFLADVNNDGLKDLLVAPNASGGSENLKCSWYYRNIGNETTATFSFQSDTFLVSEMMDAGEGSFAVFFDADQDGLKDIILGNRGYFDTSNINLYSGRLAFLKNTGSGEQPAFTLITRNFANVGSLNVKSVPPAFGDLDGDGDDDMLLGQEDGTLLFFRNTASPGSAANFVFFAAGYAGIDVGTFSAPQLVDVNRDGLIDLLIGEQSGNLNYYQNEGTAAAPSFVVQSNFFGGVDVRAPGYVTGFSTPFLYDENDGAGYKLLVGSERGTIYAYSNIDGNLGGTFTKVDSTFLGIDEGSHSSVSGGDVNADGKPDLLIGNFRGGITFYDSKLTAINEPAHESNGFITCYPSPASGFVEVVLSGFAEHKDRVLQVFDVTGRNTFTVDLIRSSAAIDVRSWPAGVYFVRVTSGHSMLVKKFVVGR